MSMINYRAPSELFPSRSRKSRRPIRSRDLQVAFGAREREPPDPRCRLIQMRAGRSLRLLSKE